MGPSSGMRGQQCPCCRSVRRGRGTGVGPKVPSHRGTYGPTGAPPPRRDDSDHDHLPRRFRGRRAPTRAPAPPGPRAPPAHPVATAATCSSTTCSGSSGPARSTTPSPTRCATAASRCSTSASCSPRPSRTTAPARGCSTASSPTDDLGRDLAEHRPRLPRRRRPGHDRHRTSSADSPSPSCPPAPGAACAPMSAGPHGFVLPPLPNHLFTRDTHLLDLRRRVDQPDGDAGPPARDRPPRGDLPLPPAVRRRDVRALVRRRRPGPRHRPRSRAATSWSSARGAVLDRHGRAHHATGRRSARPRPVRGGRRHDRHRGRAPGEAGVHAPRHGHDDGPARTPSSPIPA